MRLYLIRDHYLKPSEPGAVERRFVPNCQAAAQIVRMTDITSRPNVSVWQLEVPTAQAELAQVMTEIIHGQIPDSIVRRRWQGSRRGGLTELEPGQESAVPRARKCRVARVETQRPVEDAGAFWGRLTATK